MAQQSPLKDFQRRGKKPERVNVFDGAAQTSFVKNPELSGRDLQRKQQNIVNSRRAGILTGKQFNEAMKKHPVR